MNANLDALSNKHSHVHTYSQTAIRHNVGIHTYVHTYKQINALKYIRDPFLFNYQKRKKRQNEKIKMK